MLQSLEFLSKKGAREGVKSVKLTSIAVLAGMSPGAEALVGGGRAPAPPSIQAGAEQLTQRLLLLAPHT